MPTGTGSVAVRISPSGTAQQKHSATGSAAVHPSLTGLGGPVYAASTIQRLELWTDIQANGGTRLLFLPDVSVASSVLSIDGTESLSVVIPGTAAAATVVRENYVIRVWRSDGDFDEWAIGPLLRRRDRGGRVELTAQPLIYRLGTCGFVTEYLTTPLNGLPQLDVGVSAKTPTEIIQAYILDHPAIKAVVPWLTLGEITPVTRLDLSWSSATPLQVLRALSDAVQATGELCELRLRRVGITSYAIDLVTQVGSANTTVSLRLGRNLESLEFKTDPTDRSTRIAPVAASLAGFPTFLGAARWKVTSVNAGAKTVVLEDPAGGAGPIGFDDQLIGWYLVREGTSASALITDSVESTQTLTLSAFLTGLVAGEYVGVRTTEPATGIHSSGNGEQPYYLGHPVYEASVDPGIGVKFGTIDRSTVVGVPNLVPNALTRTYTTPTNAMPDGWTFTSVNGVSIAIPVTETFEQNTDPLYTQLGGSSMHFVINGGFIVTPPIKFAPTYLGQMISCRIRLLLTSWVDAGAQMVMTLGIRRSDGGIHYWYEQDRRLMLQPGNARPTSTWKPLASGTWVDLELSANDVTQPSTESSFPYKVTQADIDALATDAEGLVIQLWFDRDATGTAIEGYLDAAWMSPSIESPDEITEFGGANALWQATNVALGLLAPPQVTYNVGVVDLARLGVAPVTTDQLTIGCPVLVSDVELGLSNVPQRVVEMKTNHLKPGDTVITLAARNRRLTEMFLKGQQSTNKALSSGLKSLQGGGTPTTTTPPGGGTSGHPSIILTYVLTGSVPAIIATVSSGVLSVKFATSSSAYPTAATVRLASADASPPFVYDGTDGIGGAMAPHASLYVSAFAYDNNGVESALATLKIGGTPVTGSRSVTIDHTKFGGADATNFTFPVFGTFSYLASVANGGELTSVNNFAFYSDAAFTTLLKFERVVHSLTTGEIEYHVKVPSISHTVDTVIYMAWDTATVDLSDSANSFDAFESVHYRFGDGATLGLDNSTGAGALTLTNIGNAIAATGKLGGGVSQTGVPVLTRASSSPLEAPHASPFSVSCWHKPTGFGSNQMLVYNGNSGGSVVNILLDVESSSGKPRFFFTVGGGYVGFTCSSAFTVNVWSHVAATWDGGTQRIFVNGVAAGTNAAGTGPDVGNTFYIGSSPAGAFEPMSGVEDEVGLASGIARSADWWLAVYNTQNSACFTLT